MMLITMATVPMDCGVSDEDINYVDCDADLGAEEKAAKERDLERATRQEAAMKLASQACDIYVQHRRSVSAQAAVEQSLAHVRTTGFAVRDTR